MASADHWERRLAFSDDLIIPDVVLGPTELDAAPKRLTTTGRIVWWNHDVR
jgi:hypothetical protein